MARNNRVSILVDAQNKADRVFLDVERGLRTMGRTSERETSRFSRNMQRMDRAVLKFSDRMKFMDKYAKRAFKSMAVTTGVYVATTVRDFGQLENGISKVNTLYDQTSESQKRMARDSIQMFKMIPTNFENITQGIYDTVSAGADPKFATMFARKFGMATVAGSTDLPTVTKAAMGTMNAFKMKAEDLTHILDVQFLTVKRGITEYGELASSLDTGVLKAAESAGISMEELYGGIAQITKNAVPAAQASTQLGSIFARLTDSDVIKGFKKFGVDIQDAHHNTRPLVEIMKELNEQFEKKGMTKAQQAGFLKELLGRQEAVRGFQTLIDQAKEYAQIVNEMKSSDGTLQEAFEDRLNNMITQIKLLWNGIRAAGVEQLYTLKPFLDALTKPTIERQKLEMQKMELEEKYQIQTGRNYKDGVMKDSLKNIPNTNIFSILDSFSDTAPTMANAMKDIEKQIQDIDPTPVEEFRKALKESVDNLKELNPALATTVNMLGQVALSFVGEEGAGNRKILGGSLLTLGGGYLFSKLYPGAKKVTGKGVDVFKWIRGKIKGDTSPKEILKDTPKKVKDTLKTMNVNANIVNVYGKTINNGGKPGMPNGGVSPTPIVPTILPPASSIPKLPPASPTPALPNATTGVSEAIKNSASALEGAVAAKEAMTAFVSGLPVIALAGFELNEERKKNKKRDVGLNKLDKNSYITDEGVVSGKEIEKLQKIQTTFVATKESFFDLVVNSFKTGNEILAKSIKESQNGGKNKNSKQTVTNTVKGTKDKGNQEFLKQLKEINNIEKKLNVQGEVKVQAPKVTAKLYVDGKSIPVRNSYITYENIEKKQEINFRRYGRNK